MRRLEQTVSLALKKNLSCQIPYEELCRVWPDDTTRREQIAKFAREHDWQLLCYTEDSGAIFYRNN